MIAAGFLALPAVDDPLAATLRTQVRAVAARALLGFDARRLPAPLAAAFAGHQARLRRDRAAALALCADLDVLIGALVLASPPTPPPPRAG